MVDIDTRRMYLEQLLRRTSGSSGAGHFRNSPGAGLKSLESIVSTRTKSHTPKAKPLGMRRLTPCQIGGESESGLVKIVMLKKKLHL